MTRKTRAAILLFITPFLFPVAFALAQGATAPAMFTPFKKGGATTLTAATTATSGCTDGAFLYSLSSLLNCGAVLTTDGNTVTVNNGAAAASIFVAKDNGTAVFTIADGGTITGTSNYIFSTSNTGIYLGSFAPTSNTVYYNTGNTPDAGFLGAGSVSNSWGLAKSGSISSDFNNGRCGTSACNSTTQGPSFIIHSGDVATNEYGQLSVENSTGAFRHQNNVAELTIGGSKTAITEASAQAIVRVGIGTSTNVYGMTLFYTIYDINGANYVTRTGSVKVQGGNSSGTATCTINTTQDQETEDGSQVATSNAATLTYTWTNVVSTTNCDLSLNAASSEGANTYAITWTAVLNGNSSGITITPQ